MEQYPWYEVVDGASVDQGDLFFNLPIVQPIYADSLLDQATASFADAEVAYRDCIVMTQACDLAYEKVDAVVLCPFQQLGAFKAANDTYNSNKAIQRIRRGNEPSLHLLDAWEDPRMDMAVVSFRQIYSVPTPFVERFAERVGRRLRLLPPYREHLSQAFARYFMRVGLPQEIEL